MPSFARHMLGGLALSSVAFAAAAFWVFDSSTGAGIALRSGVLLGAMWFAWPELTRRSPRRLVVAAAAVGVIVLRPRTAWVLIPVFLIWMAMSRR